MVPSCVNASAEHSVYVSLATQLSRVFIKCKMTGCWYASIITHQIHISSVDSSLLGYAAFEIVTFKFPILLANLTAFTIHSEI